MADDVMHILGRLEGKMDGFIGLINRHEDMIVSLDKRLDQFDRDKSRITGLVAGVSATIGVAGTWIARKIGLV